MVAHQTNLATLEEATRMLAQCRTVDEAKKVRDLAEAARVYAREADLGGEAMNHAAEIKVRAERRVGEILVKMAENGERRTTATAKSSTAPLLDDLGIAKNESSRFQKLADVPHSDFEAYIAESKETGTPITTQGAIRSQTPAEHAAIAADQKQRHDIYDAIKALGTCELTPAKWQRLEHHASRYRVTEHIDAALGWLTELRRVWKP